MSLGKIALIIVGGVIGIFVLLAVIGSSVDTPQPTPTPTPEQLEESVTPTPSAQVEGEQTSAPEREEATVSRAIDGDTIQLSDGRTVRYIGIDTPETVHPSKPVQCLGMEASAKNKELVDGKKVKLEKDVSETDKYGRTLRYVYLDDGRMVNDILVREGFASAASYPPDVKYQDQFREAEQSARTNEWGLWSDVCTGAATAPTAATQSKAPATTSKSTTTPTKVPMATKQPTTGVNCSADTYNCDDFATCSEAQAVYNTCPGDPHGLDRDQDGTACDTLCD